jgi:hypothetical protein
MVHIRAVLLIIQWTGAEVYVPRGRGCQLEALVSEVSHRNLDRNPTPSRGHFHWRCIIKQSSAANLTANVKRKTQDTN